MLGEDVEVIVDGGTSPGGAASTIVDATRTPRPGAAASARSASTGSTRVLEPLGHAIADPDAPAEDPDAAATDGPGRAAEAAEDAAA